MSKLILLVRTGGLDFFDLDFAMCWILVIISSGKYVQSSCEVQDCQTVVSCKKIYKIWLNARF